MGRVRFGFVKVAAAVPKVSLADCQSNAKAILSLAEQGAERGASIVLFPELSLTGSSCGDLFRQQVLLNAAEQALYTLVDAHISTVMVVGLPVSYNSKIYNCAAVIADGTICGVVAKSYTSDNIFTAGRGLENRYITLCDQMVPFGSDMIFSFDGVKFSVEIGTDNMQIITPSAETASAGAMVCLCLSAQKSISGSYNSLRKRIEQLSLTTQSGYVFCSAGAGESTTDAVYTGPSIIAELGSTLAAAPLLTNESSLIVADIDLEAIDAARTTLGSTTNCDCYRVLELPASIVDSDIERTVKPFPFLPENGDEGYAEIFELQALGLAHRLNHIGCQKAVLGVSGGLDSTLALMVVARTFDILGLDHKGIVGVTMPGFGTSNRTYNNALTLMQELGITMREISICPACEQHFKDIDIDPTVRNAAYENSQARERTQILMDIANAVGGIVVGTGDLSESALGWATYNGDHMSMYNVNCSVPKTLVRELTKWIALHYENERVREALEDVVITPVSPELLPADKQGNIAQKTEDIVGPYELHDFFLYHTVVSCASPTKILTLAQLAFKDVYDRATILHWLQLFYRRFFSQQFKRSAMPDGPQVTAVSLSPRGSWAMPSDALSQTWFEDILNNA